MSNVKELITIIIAFLIVIAISFFAGNYSATLRFKNVESRVKASEQRAIDYATELDRISKRFIDITEENRELKDEVNELARINLGITDELDSLTRENDRVTIELRATKNRLSDSARRVSSVVSGIDSYIKQAESKN